MNFLCQNITVLTGRTSFLDLNNTHLATLLHQTKCFFLDGYWHRLAQSKTFRIILVVYLWRLSGSWTMLVGIFRSTTFKIATIRRGSIVFESFSEKTHLEAQKHKKRLQNFFGDICGKAYSKTTVNAHLPACAIQPTPQANGKKHWKPSSTGLLVCSLCGIIKIYLQTILRCGNVRIISHNPTMMKSVSYVNLHRYVFSRSLFNIPVIRHPLYIGRQLSIARV